MRLRTPLESKNAVAYGRYSTEEQDPTSIPDQINFCKRFLAAEGVHGRIDELSDPEMSGELRHRLGIDQVRAGIAKKSWDLIISEDSSRLFKHETACGELIEMAVDAGIRVICINDDVDTAEDDWDERLHEAQRHHVRANRYTRRRIARKMRGLWETGGAIGLLRPGYLRKPTTPAQNGQPAKGPYFDEVDPVWTPMIVEAYERVARNDPPWLVAKWLTEKGLRKCGNSTHKEWTDRDVTILIHRTIYRGEDQHRLTVSQKMYTSGKSVSRRAKPEEIWTRPMPHLRIVSDELWYRANQAIESRNRNKVGDNSRTYPWRGAPRDSRGPLSQLFVCGNCGEKMYAVGRNEGGYRCSDAHKKKPCWNRTTALRNLTHARISAAVAERLLLSVGAQRRPAKGA